MNRKVVELGCKSNCENDSQFVHQIKFISALAFLPVYEVEEGFRTLTNHSAFPVDPNCWINFKNLYWVKLTGIKRRAYMYNQKLMFIVLVYAVLCYTVAKHERCLVCRRRK